MPGTRTRMLRAGFCGMRTRVRRPACAGSLSGGLRLAGGLRDPASAQEAAGLEPRVLEPFDTIAIQMRGDGRKYIATLRTETWIAMPVGS